MPGKCEVNAVSPTLMGASKCVEPSVWVVYSAGRSSLLCFVYVCAHCIAHNGSVMSLNGCLAGTHYLCCRCTGRPCVLSVPVSAVPDSQ